MLIMRAHNRPVEEKSEVNIIHVHYKKKYNYLFLILQALHQAEQHLLLVTQERSIYRAEVDEEQVSGAASLC